MYHVSNLGNEVFLYSEKTTVFYFRKILWQIVSVVRHLHLHVVPVDLRWLIVFCSTKPLF